MPLDLCILLKSASGGGYDHCAPVLLALSASRLRRFLSAYILAVALITLAFAALNARVAHPWIIGEWLINYSGGFLRRGLLGEALLLLHRVSRIPLVGLAAALQLLLYSAFYLSLLPLLRGVRWSLALLALLLSPATLAFTVLDPPTSVRKEVLLFLALSLLVNAVISFRPRPWPIALALSIAAPILVLIHEALAAFLPYLFLPLLLTVPRARDAARLVVLPLALTALAFVAVITHAGGSREAAAICSSVGGHLDHQPAGLCNGAIAYFKFTPTEARAETLRAIRLYRYRTRYPLPILLTFAPVVLLLAARLRTPDALTVTRRLVGVTLLSLLASLPLFVIARDWGRWLEIHATCLLLLFLLIERPAASPQQISIPASPDETTGLRMPEAVRPRVTRLLALAFYVTCWTLPAVGIFPGRFGYVDLVRYLISYRGKPHLSTAPGRPAFEPAAKPEP